MYKDSRIINGLILKMMEIGIRNLNGWVIVLLELFGILIMIFQVCKSKFFFCLKILLQGNVYQFLLSQFTAGTYRILYQGYHKLLGGKIEAESGTTSNFTVSNNI